MQSYIGRQILDMVPFVHMRKYDVTIWSPAFISCSIKILLKGVYKNKENGNIKAVKEVLTFEKTKRLR